MTEPASLLRAWAVGAVRSITPTEPGHNNRSWVVEAEGGDYVLRAYDNLGEEAIRFEHALLTHLGDAELPYAVPVPVQNKDGQTLHLAAGVDGAQVRAALFPFLPGAHPTRDDPAAAAALGVALAHLHPALLAAGEVLGVGVNPGYGDVRHIHPLIAEPLEVGDLLALDVEPKRRLRRAFERAFETATTLYTRLPQQLVHSDFGTFNVLMRDSRVTAVIDFEFSSGDVRAMDLASAVRDFGHSAWFGSAGFELPERFMRGYAGIARPTEDEIAAVPDLIRLAIVVILIHWVGRWKQGVTERAVLDGTVNWVLTIDTALTTRGPMLVETLRRAVGS